MNKSLTKMDIWLMCVIAHVFATLGMKLGEIIHISLWSS